MGRSAGWLAVGMFAVALAGCGGSGATALRAHKAPPTTLSARSVEDEQIVTAWKAAAEAFSAAAETNDYNSPALAASFTGTLLDHIRGTLYGWAVAGFKTEGNYNPGHPIVRQLSGDTAIVASCIYNGQIEVGPNGIAVSGSLGKAEYDNVQATMINLGGIWKVSVQQLSEVPRC